MKQKKYTKLLTVIPLACMLSTPVLLSPVATFAAEQTTNAVSQENVIQGYLFKDGVKTPIYKNSNNRTTQTDGMYPTLVDNPDDGNAPVPQSGKIVNENGDPGSILYFSKFILDINKGMNLTNVYLEKQANGIELGFYNPDTLVRTPAILANGALVGVQGAYIGLQLPEGAKVKISTSYFSNNKIKRETSYQLLPGSSHIQGVLAPYQFSQSIKTGVSNSDMIGGSLTLGYKLSFTEGMPGVASSTQEFSTQLTASYSKTITVSKEVTDIHTFTLPKVADKYPHQKYQVAIYQLRSKYTFMPGTSLQQGISDGKVTLAGHMVEYADDTFYQATTPGADTNR